MKIERKHVLAVSAALFCSTLLLAGCSREIGAASTSNDAARAANDAARSAADATGAASSAVDHLVDANQALLFRVEDLEAKLARAEGREVERAAAPRYPSQSERTYSRNVSADYRDYVPESESSRTEYRYDDERFRTEPVLADARPDWSTPSRFRDVPRPSSPPREHEERSEPTWRRLTVESGTPIAVKILTSVSTKLNHVGDHFTGRLADNLLTDSGQVAIREGARITGHVSALKKSQRIGGRPSMTLSMDSIELPDGSTAPITAAWATTGKSQTTKDAATIGGATVGGAILGRILDRGNSDVIGGLVGAAAGTALARQVVGKPLAVGSGAVLHMHLRSPIDVRVRS